MNYLTNYYKNLSEKLEAEVNALEGQVKLINESMASYAPVNRPRGIYGYAGQGMGGQQAFSGQQLGQMLGSGNMNIANDYLSQYGGGMPSNNMGVAGPAAFRSGGPSPKARNRPRTATPAGEEGMFGGAVPSDVGPAGGGVPGDYNGDGRVDGADLGMALGQGANTSNVLQNWSLPYSQQGPAYSQAGPGLGAASNRSRGAVGYAGGPGGQQQAFSGQQLGQMLGGVGPGQQGMNFVNDYLSQYGGGMPSSNMGVAGPASMQAMMNRARGARRGAGRSATGQ